MTNERKIWASQNRLANYRREKPGTLIASITGIDFVLSYEHKKVIYTAYATSLAIAPEQAMTNPLPMRVFPFISLD